MTDRTIEYLPLTEVSAALRNPKGHDDILIADSITTFGYIEPVQLDERTGRLVAGHGRLDNLRTLEGKGGPAPDGIQVDENGRWLLPVVRGWSSVDDAHAEAALLTLNRGVERGGWNEGGVAEILRDLVDVAPGLVEIAGYSPAELEAMLGRNPAGGAGEVVIPPEGPSLADRFIVPPFTVLDARQGYWQARKTQWMALGIRSEEGRRANLLGMSETVLEASKPKSAARKRQPNMSNAASPSGADPGFFRKMRAASEKLGRELTTGEFLESGLYEASAYTDGVSKGTSVFDPVLCEIAYRWFSPEGGQVLDPFAGGSVRGVVASRLRRRYLGIELRGEQIDANEKQADDICTDAEFRPEWRAGDSTDLLPEAPEADLIFSCPPYWNLELYSEDPADLSNAPTWEDFSARYSEIVARACARLRDDRFAVFVIGNLRTPAGDLLDFGNLTREAFAAAGLEFYNDAVLVTSVGSLALRAARNFRTRKLGRCHQLVSVFLKGDAQRAVEACGDVLIEDPAALFGEPMDDAPEIEQ